MNDDLRDAIVQGLKNYNDRKEPDRGPIDCILHEVRAWLALPPSEEEIEAAARASNSTLPGVRTLPGERERAERALVASRAVLVRPPEETT